MSDDQEIGGDDILEATPSISPMAVSVPFPTEEADASEDDEVARMMLAHRKLRLRKIVRTALGASVAIIVAATIRTGVDAASTPAHAAGSRAQAPLVTQPAPPPPVAAKAPEAPATGTITAPRGQAFIVDGTPRAAGASVVVTCGSHTVRVGRDAPQTLDVPCGKTVMAGKPKR